MTTTSTNSLYNRSLNLIDQLADLRNKLADVNFDLLSLEREIGLKRAKYEIEIIQAAGGEKELGSNAEARNRELAVGLNRKTNYTCLLKKQEKQHLTKWQVQGRIQTCEDELKLIRAMLNIKGGLS